MIKTIEVIVFLGLLVFSFFLGVRYSDTVKENISWLQTKSDEELELPSLNDDSPDAGMVPNPDGESAPMDDISDNENNGGSYNLPADEKGVQNQQNGQNYQNPASSN